MAHCRSEIFSRPNGQRGGFIHNYALVASIIASVLLLVATIFDVEESVMGLNRNLAVEGNWLIRRVWGPRPKGWQYYLIELGILILFLVAALLLPFPLDFVFIGAMLGYSLKHLQGGLKWRKLLKD